MLTEENVRKVLSFVMSEESNLTYLRSRFEETHGMSDDAAVAWSVDRLYSDVLLAGLKDRLRYVPVCSMSAFGYDTADDVSEYERDFGYSCEVMPKVWPKRLVVIGSDVDECNGGTLSFWHGGGLVLCIDEDGELVCFDEFRNGLIFDEMDEGDDLHVVYRLLANDSMGEVMLLNEIEDLLPAEFKGFWDI